jgi:S1-C subfamily serine protease
MTDTTGRPDLPEGDDPEDLDLPEEQGASEPTGETPAVERLGAHATQARTESTGEGPAADESTPWKPWPPPAEPVTAEPDRTGTSTWTVALIGIAAALIGAIVGVTTLQLTRDDPAATQATVVQRVETRTVEVAANPATTAAEVARRVLPSIVTVEQGRFDEDEDGNTFFVRTGGGSGVVIDNDGHLVTNHHVIEDAEVVRIVFPSGRIVPASVIGSDSLTDIAVIAVDLRNLTPIRLGSTTALSVGDAAYAVGNPLTLEGGPSVTSGVISAFDRRVRLQGGRELFGMLQTDAPITRGSSGGALVDSEGRLVGITTAVAVSDLGQEGLGFAIPVELVKRVTDDIIANGSTSHAFLGILGGTHFTDFDDGSSEPSGVEVAEALEGTAAEQAGVMAGDIIVSYGRQDITTMEQLILLLRLDRVGDIVDLGILRDGERITVSVELMERPEGV